MARKTANVVLGTAFGIAEGVVVDTHIQRLSMRLGLTRSTDPKDIEKDLMQVLPRDHWIRAGHQLIWHGRRVCFARKPNCAGCTLAPFCPSAGLESYGYGVAGQPLTSRATVSTYIDVTSRSSPVM